MVVHFWLLHTSCLDAFEHSPKASNQASWSTQICRRSAQPALLFLLAHNFKRPSNSKFAHCFTSLSALRVWSLRLFLSDLPVCVSELLLDSLQGCEGLHV